MKKLFAVCMLLVFTMILLCPAVAEETPAFLLHEVEYDGHVLSGHAHVPRDGDYYARITFVCETYFMVLSIPIQQTGDFILPIAVPCDMYSVEITDQYSANVPSTIYAWFYSTLIAEPT